MNKVYSIITMITLLLFCTPSTAQKIVTGKTVTMKDIARYVEIHNISNYTKTLSDEEGNFKLRMSLNDSIAFSAPLYEKMVLKINTKHLEEDLLIIQLKEKTNHLNEIILETKIQPKEFDIDAINRELKTLAAKDLKNNPDKYIKKEELIKDGINLLGLIEFTAKLFRKKDTSKKTDIPIVSLKFEDFKWLLDNDEAISISFLTHELNLPKDQIPSFLYYLEDKKIVLNRGAVFKIIDEMVIAAKEFNGSKEN